MSVLTKMSDELARVQKELAEERKKNAELAAIIDALKKAAATTAAGAEAARVVHLPTPGLFFVVDSKLLHPDWMHRRKRTQSSKLRSLAPNVFCSISVVRRRRPKADSAHAVP